ncbi:hypothetical protein NQZ68_039620 [Dissostichus eleginoides]|nr:hypothetical protein NQZ68_039620 [Dissostichus eleginoides]
MLMFIICFFPHIVSADFMLNQQKKNTIISLLGAALAICVIVNAFIFYAIKKLQGKSCGVCNSKYIH